MSVEAEAMDLESSTDKDKDTGEVAVAPVRSEEVKQSAEDVIVLSSDSETEEAEPAAEIEDDGLEIIKEVRSFSYMNRPRGPKTAFLKTLLQETNRDLQLGLPLNNSSKQIQLQPFEETVRAPAPVRQNSDLNTKVHEEVTLSSDDEEEEVQTEDLPSPDSASAVPMEEEATIEKEVESKSELLEDSSNDIVKSPVSIIDAVSENASESSTSKLTKHSTIINDTRQETKSVKPVAVKRASGSNPSSSSLHRKKPKPSMLAFLESGIQKKIDQINELGEEEVDFDDEENSSFLKRQRFSVICDKSFRILCKSQKCTAKVGRPTENKFKLKENLTPFPLVEKAVETFMNANQPNYLPSYDEILDVVQHESADTTEFSSDSETANSTAKTIFEEIVRCVKERRSLDSLQSGFCCDIRKVLSEPGPADTSPELAAKLQENVSLMKNEQEVIDLFVAKQDEEELEQKNPKLLEASKSESDTDQKGADDDLPDSD